ncbi:hypothetical protein BZL39_G06520 [Zygosaccharomyces parabailii]|nr:hypothetical protein BZL39_G00120 [Zygosaccharomyces parabailii]AQZ14634.1 hypothetical protein BZL39_G06520 [Zygosaccharomyces parabailii]CDH13216.1 uncharacterized protein ZBAI_05002 [Zygosaccharomyces bailii ISA1307]
MSRQKTKDLENCVGMDEEEEVQLLEDRRAGNLIYFISWYFFRGKWLWNIILPIGCVIIAFFTWLSYLGLRDTYYYQLDNTKTSEPFPVLWLSIHYFLAFVIFFLGCMEERRNLIMESNILQKLLEEVSETELMSDPVVWRRIAFNVNQYFVGKKYDSSIFYGGEQCKLFFVKEVVIPVDSGSYDIRTYYNGYIYTDYCKDPSNKKLALRAVANYNKSIEYHGELSHVDGEVEYDNGLFEKFHIISMASVLYLFSIEITLSMIMLLTMFALVIYRAIFN